MKSVYYFLASFALFYFIFLGHFTNSEAKDFEPKIESAAEVEHADEEVLAEVSASTEQTTPSPSPTPKPTPSPSPEPTAEPTTTPEPTKTPEPVPTTTPDVWSPPDMKPIFDKYAGMYGVDVNILERLAVCESHFNPNAVSGDYVGMFQFSTSTWQNYRSQLGLDANPDLRRDVEASIQTAAFVVQQRGTAPWPKCI